MMTCTASQDGFVSRGILNSTGNSQDGVKDRHDRLFILRCEEETGFEDQKEGII
jgi:hypothetical protein